MRPIERGGCPVDNNQQKIVFSHYSDARGELIKRMGQYCSYCEMKLDASLAVEHVQPKKARGSNVVNQTLLLDWENFLLACTNCNSTKGNKPVVLTDYVWPDTDNTFRAFVYSTGGIISAAPGPVHQEAKNMIALVGLDKKPDTADASDRRWSNRLETWAMAERARTRLINRDSIELRETIAEHAYSQGYWSIWMTVFSHDSDMLRRIIAQYMGTSALCFNNTGMALPRPQGKC